MLYHTIAAKNNARSFTRTNRNNFKGPNKQNKNKKHNRKRTERIHKQRRPGKRNRKEQNNNRKLVLRLHLHNKQNSFIYLRQTGMQQIAEHNDDLQIDEGEQQRTKLVQKIAQTKHE